MGFYSDYAKTLIIKPVWQRSDANDTGYLTPPSLYNIYQPYSENIELIHATVGTNTLPYFADRVDSNWNVVQLAGSMTDGRRVCAHQLIPKDARTIYDMVPSGYGCGHCNPGRWRGYTDLNHHARGYELENLQNGDGGDSFTESQYIKLALSIAYHAAAANPHVNNLHICSHFDATASSNLAGVPATHTDPNSGPFDWGRFWGHLWGARADASLFQYWGVFQYDGR